jgi:hypothetical protein
VGALLIDAFPRTMALFTGTGGGQR